jgi:2-oxoglutarate dehydrogenase E1 component
VLDDPEMDGKGIEKLVFCSGKVYYDLVEYRAKTKYKVAIVRIEQLFPFPTEQVQAIIKKYKDAKEIIWAQEEPENMGAWGFLLRVMSKGFDKKITVVAQPASASPATGSAKMAAARHRAVLEEAIGKI